MSTLCVYENYLRDRYVLGQSVHYAAGSSSPKPKSYDREGNEYTWSDEAGDYVRQVGGPGGGRTIRLSEVEKTEIEQPQNEQVNADSGQHGSKKEATPQSNVNYSEFADAYKRYRAEGKKVASLKRKASKIQKAVLNPSLSATPEEIKSDKESLAKIRDEISASEQVQRSLTPELAKFVDGNRVVFIDNGDTFVINPSSELVQALGSRIELLDSLKKAQKASKEAKKRGLNGHAGELDSVARKVEDEITRVNNLLSQMFPNETVVSAVDKKPKRRPANRKKEPQEERAEENAYRNDDEAGATEFKPGDLLFKRNLLDHKTGYGSYRSQPSEYGKADLGALFHALNACDLSYFEDINPADFDNSKKFMVTTRLGDKKEFTARSLFEEIQEESADGDGGFNIYNNADTNNFIDRYKGSKGWPRRFQKFFSETNKEPKLNWQLRLAANTLEDTNYEFARGEFGGDYAPQYLNSVYSLVADLGQSLPPINADPKIKADFLNRYLCFLCGSALAAYASDEEGLHRKEADKLAWQFLEAGRGEVASRHLKKLFNAAKKQGFTSPAIDSPIGINSGVHYWGDLQKKENAPAAQKQEPKDVVARDVKSASGPGVDTNADSFVEGVEADGSGLPSSESTSSVVKDGSSNKDAADFTRRDLEDATRETKDPNAQPPASETKESIEKPGVSNFSTPEQQTEPVAETVQEQPAKPRPERWTPLKSKMNDDDRRVIENTRKRLNFGLADFAWRIANAKEKKDWQKAKELTVLAAQRYLEQARRAYRSHGGAEALAAFDESLSSEGLTVGQVRDRVVDKFRQLALMNVADLHKYAGERLDEWEAFSQGAELPAMKNKITLYRLLDKPHYAPNAVPYTPPEKGKIYEVPVDALNLDPSRFQFKTNTNARGVTDDLEGAEFDPIQAGIIHVWRDPDDGKDYVVNGHHRFNLAKNSGYNGKVNVRYIDADTADDAKAFGAVANIADSKGTATDVAEFIRTRGSDDIRTPGGKKIATKNKLLADGRVLSKLDETIFRKLKNGSIDEKTARVIAAELPDDKDKQLRLFADIERLGLDASQAQDRAWAYASIQGEKQQGSLFGDDAPMEYDVESRSKLIGEIRKALSGVKRAAQAGGNSRNNEYWESQKLATNFDRDRAKQLSKSAGQALDFFKDHIRLTGPVQNIIKEETDEYRKAIKAGKGAEKVVERAIERIKDVAQGGDGSVRRVEGLGLEYEDRLPSAKSEQTGQGVEAKGGGEKTEPPRTPSESLRNGTTGKVLETGGADRPSDGGDGRNLTSVIAEEAKKSDIPESRVREELSSPTDKGSEKTSSSSASSPEGMSDWERELEKLRELNLLEDPDTTQVRKRGSGSNAAVSSSPQTLASGGASTSSFVHTPTKQQRIDAYIAEQRAQGREIKGLTAEDYARIFPDEEQAPAGEQSTVPRKKRGRPRIIRTDDSKQTAGNRGKIKREAQNPEVPKEQVQEKIVEAVSDSSNTRKPQTPSLQEPGGRNAVNSQALSEPKSSSSPHALSDSAQQEIIQSALREVINVGKSRFDNVEGGEEFKGLLDVLGSGKYKPSEVLAILKQQQDAGAEPLGENVVQDRIAEAVAGGDASKRKRNLQRSTKPQEDSLLDNKRKDNISDEEARRRIAKDNLDSFLSAFNSIPKKAPSYWLAREIVSKINDRINFGGWFAKASIREILKKFVEDQRMREFYSTGPSRLDSAAKDLAARLGIERGSSFDYFSDLIKDLDRAWLQTRPENVAPHDITSYRNGTYTNPISPQKKANRPSSRSSRGTTIRKKGGEKA